MTDSAEHPDAASATIAAAAATAAATVAAAASAAAATVAAAAVSAATTFDSAVRSTSAFGELHVEVVASRRDIAALDTDVKDIKNDVKHIRHTLDRYAGAMVVVGTLISISVTLVATLFRH